MRKVALLSCIFLAWSMGLFAQGEGQNNRDHDYKKFYFGISFGGNSSQYKIFHDEWFIQYDSIKEITPKWSPGFQLGIMGNLRLGDFVDFRSGPFFVLREKSVDYRFYDDTEIKSSFESILFSWPAEFKFKSDRQNNFRFYTLLGGKVDYDFNSSVRSRRPDDLLKTRPFDYGYNVGLGFEFYFANFIFAPELKLSQGLRNNLIKADNDEQTAKAIDRLTTRMIIFSIHIQG